jgi:hypothetical protein
MSYNATLVIKRTATAKKYGVRFAKSKRIVWCKDYWDATRRMTAAGKKSEEPK